MRLYAQRDLEALFLYCCQAHVRQPAKPGLISLPRRKAVLVTSCSCPTVVLVNSLIGFVDASMANSDDLLAYAIQFAKDLRNEDTSYLLSELIQSGLTITSATPSVNEVQLLLLFLTF